MEMPAVSSPEVADRRRVALDAADAAWLAVVPTALIALAAILVLGPPLGATLLPAPDARFLAGVTGVRPEPTEQARYLVALAAPLLLTALTPALMRRPPRWPDGRAAGAIAGRVELVAVVLVAACFLAQRFQSPQSEVDRAPIVYFTLPSVLAALAIAAAIALGVRSRALRAAWTRWTVESRGRRVGALLVALVALVVTLLPALNGDGSLAHEYEAVIYHLQFTYDESVAVLDGRSPLGDFATQYSTLWPYALAGAMSLLGTSVGVFTGLMAGLMGVTLMALYDVLRRAARNSVAALLLFLPLLATFALRLHGPAVARFSLVTYFGVFPLRYAGPFLLAWLVARHLDGARPRRLWPLFLAGGLVVLNNTDFGMAALGATLAALLWTRTRRPDRATLRRAALEAGAGLAVAYALVAALLLARTGAPPHLGLLVRYARIFVVDGFAMLPIKPVIGFSTVIYFTHVAAIGVATVRALRRAPDRLLTGMLAWSAVFGLGAGSYYVGHSLSEVLVYTFPCWALTVALLTLLTVRGLGRAAAERRPSAGQLACLVGFGLLACSLAQTSPPWRQLQRLSHGGPPVFAHPIGEPFVAQYSHPGEAVLVMSALGHRIGLNLGLDDVEPFTGARSLTTVEQVEESLAALRAAGGTKVFVLLLEAFPGLTAVLERDYAFRARSPEGMALWVRR
jgi:hypothetical protein